MATFTGISVVILLLFVCVFETGVCEEPSCSKFAFQEQLLEKMVRMEFKVETMVTEIKTTQDEVKRELKSIRDNVMQDLETIKLETKTMKTDIAHLKEEITRDFTLQSGTMTETFKQQESQIVRLSDDIRHLKNVTVKELTDLAVTPTVAFKTRHVADTSPATNQIIIFTTNMLNEGQGYDNATGVFTAPTDGVYLFTVQFCTQSETRYIHFSIIVDNESIQTGVMGDSDANTCHSIDTVSIMKSGMRAWVKCKHGYSVSFLYTDAYRWNTFSGVLLHK